jgi:hypothetical protein
MNKMLGIKFFKAEPTEFARMRVGDKVSKEGVGISGFYLPFRTTIEMVPVTTGDQPFVFQEVSEDDQEVNLQGGFIYRVSDPKATIGRYNFSIDPRTKKYQSEDSRKLPEHILQIVRGEARKIVQKTKLENLLVMGDELAKNVGDVLGENGIASDMGVDFQTLYFESIRPKPEIAKALEANYRESLLQRADEAIYARRAQAVEKERVIQENEMKTQIEMEEKRKQLVELEGANTIQEAEYKAQATKKELEAYENVGPEMVRAQALLRLGENASRIENLTITPDLLSGIMDKVRA